MVSPDKRYKLLPDHTLEIRKITPNDGGDYSCKISVLGEPIEIRHTLEILRKSFSYFAGFLFFFAHWLDIENRILANAVNFSSFCKKKGEIVFLEYQRFWGKYDFKTQFWNFGVSDQCANMPIIITCIPYITKKLAHPHFNTKKKV